MNTRARLNLSLALTFLVMFCATSALLYRALMDGALNEVRRESMLRMEMALAVREYTIEDVRPLLQALGHKYKQPAIPAYAANRSMELLEREHAQYRYQEVALNPMNPANRPSAWQADAIEAFRTDPARNEMTVFTDGPNGQVMHVLRPVRPTSDCMSCHGPAANAPADLLQRYAGNGLGWKVGDTVGAQIVSVPTDHAMRAARETWWWHVSATLTVFGVLFLVLNRMLSRMVIAPIETRSSAWRELATKDALTGVLNRRSFDEQAQALVAACNDSGAPLALVAMDIDHFKRINDSFGHAVGDAVLKEFTLRILQTSKRRDCLYRVGGEEFALLLPHTGMDAAAAFAEVLRRSLERTAFSGAGHLSASFGVADLLPGDSLQSLMRRADEALYAAKANGRNRVERARTAHAQDAGQPGPDGSRSGPPA
jgi:diguanylate cyclase (GGDEF)-like protein